MLQSRNARLSILVLILLLGATARFVHIGSQSLWADEGFSYYTLTQPDLIQTMAQDTHPPLYFGGLSLWTGLAGITEVALRFFSLIPSVISIAVVYQVARELVYARGESPNASVVPLLATLMMALADAEILLSQEVRHYTWLVLLVTCSMWAFLRWLRLGQRRWLIAWIVFTIVLIYTHYLGAFIGVVQGLYALLFLRGHQRIVAIGALVLSALVLVPWLLIAGRQQVGHSGVYWSLELSWTLLADIRRDWFGQMWPLTMGLALLGVVTLVYRKTVQIQWRPVHTRVLLVLWAVLPVILTIIGDQFIPILAPHRMTHITPAIAILLAFGLANFRNPARGFLIAVIVLYGVTTVDFERPKPPWREVGQQIADYVQPTDLVLIDVGGSDNPMLYYYTRFLPEDTPIVSLKNWRTYDADTYEAGLPALIDGYESVWFMHWSSDESAVGWLNNLGFTQTARFAIPHAIAINVYEDLTTFRYDRLPDESVTTYANGMILRQATVYDDDLLVEFWWETDTPLDVDYTVSAFLLDENGALVAQLDSQPLNNTRPTSSWSVGEVIYDPHVLVPIDGQTLGAGTYTVGVVVYRWSPDAITRILTEDGADNLTIGTIMLE